MTNLTKKAELSPAVAAVRAFAFIDSEVENAETLDERLKETFALAKGQRDYEVDKCILALRWLEKKQKAAEDAAADFQAQADYYAEHVKNFKAFTKAQLEACPGEEFRGSLGPVWIQKNRASIDYDFGSKHVDENTIKMFGVPDEYVIAEQIPATVEYKINAEKLMADLEAGKEVPWARIKQTTSVRFPPKKDPKKLKGANKFEIEG